jgi:hypothetical protein
VKIIGVSANTRRRTFEVRTRRGHYYYPFVKTSAVPSVRDRITSLYVDPECSNEAFTYDLESGATATVHIDAVLDYARDPDYLTDMLLYRLSIEAERRVRSSSLSVRELIRRLDTSPAQFYRLLDPTNYRKSVRQMFTLLHALDCDISFVITRRRSA